MAKVKKAYFCKECGYEAPKWMGRCPACGEWNTFTEEIVARESGSVPAAMTSALPRSTPQRVGEIRSNDRPRLDLGNAEVNRVLGGGLVPGSLVLLGGEPGIGKSTLSLQIALADNGLKTLYVSGEESAEQIKMRADRIGIGNDACMVYSETLLENIMAQLEEQRPDLVIIDSIQTIYTDLIESSAGSVSQIRECAATLLKYAKGSGTSIFIIGHITKEGAIAGPKILEHIVDVVLQFEGDNNQVYRILRGIKNRFGATFEIGVFEMLDAGLRPVGNPSEILLTHYDAPLSGIAVGASVDGIRPYLIEVQALVSNAAYGTPQRTATGFDYKRMSMLLAVLEKRVGMKMYTKHGMGAGLHHHKLSLWNGFQLIRRHECPLHHLQGLAGIVFPPGDGAGEDGAAAQGLGQHLRCLALGREAAEDGVLAVVLNNFASFSSVVFFKLR